MNSIQLLELVTTFFMESRDFNGIPLHDIGTLADTELRNSLLALIKNGDITLVFDSHSGNPHIKRLPDLSIEDQLKKVNEVSSKRDTICIYPTAKNLQPLIDPSKYEGKPFTKRLALAEAQLTPIFFDLDVLEKYFRNPLYLFRLDDFGGTISVKGEHYESEDVSERDKILLSSFGIAYDDKRRRVVVAYLRYLADLSPEHQQTWNAHVVTGPCKMNSDYELATIYGEWPEHHSVYEAFVVEQVEINKLCDLIGKPPLFRETFEEERRPKEFIPMLLPTKKNLHEFAQTLDKMLSENINQSFFTGDVATKDGAGQTKGTIQLLRDFLDQHYQTEDKKKVGDEVVAPLKEVRALRTVPAHKIEQDSHSYDYPRQQDELLGRVIQTLRKLRYVLMAHPKARGVYNPPEWLDGDKIVFY